MSDYNASARLTLERAMKTYYKCIRGSLWKSEDRRKDELLKRNVKQMLKDLIQDERGNDGKL